MALLRILSESDARSLLDDATALDLARATMLDHAAGRNHLSTPSVMTLDASRDGGPKFKFKAATLSHLQISGVRLLCRFEGNTGDAACNYTAIYDHNGGGLVGLVSELWLSRMRTAAFGVVAVEPLVRPGPLKIGLFGAGDIAAAMLPLLARTFKISEMRVNSRRSERAHAFANRFSALLGISIRGEQDPREVVCGADLVITLTESREPLIRSGWLEPGAVLCSMGNYNEIEFDALREMDRVIVDDPDFAAAAGDGASWISQGHLTRAQLLARIDALAADVMNGAKPGRLSSEDRVLALIQGIAVGDVAFAARVLQNAVISGSGQTVALP